MLNYSLIIVLHWGVKVSSPGHSQRKSRESLTIISWNDDILKVIRNLDLNKVYSHDMIGIRMVKICDNSICKPLKLFFQSSLESGKFPSEWKKAKVLPVHKKGDKQILRKYRPILLLPITGKIFEKLLYDRVSVWVFYRK